MSVTADPARATQSAVYRPAAPAPMTATSAGLRSTVQLRYSAMAAAPLLLMHESSLEHDTGAHPERAERIVAITTELGNHDWAGYELVGSPQASDAALAAVHSE